MAKLFEKMLAEVAKLPDAEKESLAAWVLEELESEQRWAEAFARSADKLGKLAEEALAEHRGRTLQKSRCVLTKTGKKVI